MTRCWVCNEEFGVDGVHICAGTPFKIKSPLLNDVPAPMDAAAMLRKQADAIRVLREALHYIAWASAPMTTQQEECWPVMHKALKDTEEFK